MHAGNSAVQGRFGWDEVSAARFAEYHAENPQVYEVLRRFALEAKRAGRERLSIGALFERVRWETSVDGNGDSFKVNNSHRSFYARLLMAQEPDLRGFFETRRAKADAA
jgi:hypothetical protein